MKTRTKIMALLMLVEANLIWDLSLVVYFVFSVGT